ncbi:MAG: 30S ribosomal protein S9 [Chloroflexi bacterium]|nr:30S ribosomal protein S9 [Chloroflexota bacterium]MBI3041083.1 30S ribosomal protein S9 [Chloroflexota bacterium]MBI3931322.1 30S ribosomal protein S9 [Chloroflexota bacterium]
MAKETYFQKTGRRKTAIAQVRLLPKGSGAIIVNGTPYEELFPRLAHRQTMALPLILTETLGRYNVMVKVTGGGISGQSGAISHGIARALVEADESLKPVLRQNGLLTRDPRAKERKKPGLKRARKAKQYTKR